jgi:hypothetical protein
LAVSNATLRIEDRKSGEIVEFSGLNLRTGGFVPGQPLAFTLAAPWAGRSMDWVARAQLYGRLKTDFSDLSGNLIEEGSLQLDAPAAFCPRTTGPCSWPMWLSMPRPATCPCGISA